MARLLETLDALLALDPTQVPDADVPGVVTGLVQAGHRVHAAQLDAVAAFDAAQAAAPTVHRTTTRWLEHRTRLGPAQAAGLVRSARAVRDHLPATRDAAAAGRISPQHVSAITAAVHAVGVEHAARAEPILLELAGRAEPGVVRRAVAHLHATLDPDGAQAALDRVYERRGVTVSVVGSRAYLDGVLDVESAEVLQAALVPLMTRAADDPRSTPQRRADALVDLARRALDAGDLPVLGGRRPHLSLVMPGEALRSGRGSVTLPWTGAAIPVLSARRLACDGELSPVWARCVGRHGWAPLAVGRVSRTVTPAQLTALHVRDGGCVHPGCTRTPAFCDAHHIRHWADGGATDLDNLALLCRHHHRTLHAGTWQLHTSGDGELTVLDHTGAQHPAQTATDRSPPLRPQQE